MIKKTLYTSLLVLLAVCLAGLAFAWTAPVRPVRAAGDSISTLSSAGPAEEETQPLPRPVQPGIFAAAGVVSGLFGVLAFSPLLLEDPLAGQPGAEQDV